jgi:hypothetical protein
MMRATTSNYAIIFALSVRREREGELVRERSLQQRHRSQSIRSFQLQMLSSLNHLSSAFFVFLFLFFLKNNTLKPDDEGDD